MKGIVSKAVKCWLGVSNRDSLFPRTKILGREWHHRSFEAPTRGTATLESMTGSDFYRNTIYKMIMEQRIGFLSESIII